MDFSYVEVFAEDGVFKFFVDGKYDGYTKCETDWTRFYPKPKYIVIEMY